MKARNIILATLVTLGAFALSTTTADAHPRKYKRYNNSVVYYGPSSGYYATGVRYGRPAYNRSYNRPFYHRPYYRPSSGVSVRVNVR